MLCRENKQMVAIEVLWKVQNREQPVALPLLRHHKSWQTWKRNPTHSRGQAVGVRQRDHREGEGTGRGCESQISTAAPELVTPGSFHSPVKINTHITLSPALWAPVSSPDRPHNVQLQQVTSQPGLFNEVQPTTALRSIGFEMGQRGGTLHSLKPFAQEGAEVQKAAVDGGSLIYWEKEEAFPSS